jgi:hypothetical protein
MITRFNGLKISGEIRGVWGVLKFEFRNINIGIYRNKNENSKMKIPK